MQAKLTKRVVDEAKPGVNDLLIWDTQLKGFGLKVTPTGTKTYLYQYRIGGRAGKTRRVTIGKHGSSTQNAISSTSPARALATGCTSAA